MYKEIIEINDYDYRKCHEYQKNRHTSMIGQSILYATIELAIGSLLLLDSPILLINNENIVIDSVRTDIHEFLIASIIIIIGTGLLMYAKFGMKGLLINTLICGAVAFWLYYRYNNQLKKAEKNHKISIDNTAYKVMTKL